MNVRSDSVFLEFFEKIDPEIVQVRAFKRNVSKKRRFQN